MWHALWLSGLGVVFFLTLSLHPLILPILCRLCVKIANPRAKVRLAHAQLFPPMLLGLQYAAGDGNVRWKVSRVYLALRWIAWLKSCCSIALVSIFVEKVDIDITLPEAPARTAQAKASPADAVAPREEPGAGVVARLASLALRWFSVHVRQLRLKLAGVDLQGARDGGLGVFMGLSGLSLRCASSQRRPKRLSPRGGLPDRKPRRQAREKPVWGVRPCLAVAEMELQVFDFGEPAVAEAVAEAVADATDGMAAPSHDRAIAPALRLRWAGITAEAHKLLGQSGLDEVACGLADFRAEVEGPFVRKHIGRVRARQASAPAEPGRGVHAATPTAPAGLSPPRRPPGRSNPFADMPNTVHIDLENIHCVLVEPDGSEPLALDCGFRVRLRPPREPEGPVTLLPSTILAIPHLEVRAFSKPAVVLGGMRLRAGDRVGEAMDHANLRRDPSDLDGIEAASRRESTIGERLAQSVLHGLEHRDEEVLLFDRAADVSLDAHFLRLHFHSGAPAALARVLGVPPPAMTKPASRPSVTEQHTLPQGKLQWRCRTLQVVLVVDGPDGATEENEAVVTGFGSDVAGFLDGGKECYPVAVFATQANAKVESRRLNINPGLPGNPPNAILGGMLGVRLFTSPVKAMPLKLQIASLTAKYASGGPGPTAGKASETPLCHLDDLSMSYEKSLDDVGSDAASLGPDVRQLLASHIHVKVRRASAVWSPYLHLMQYLAIECQKIVEKAFLPEGLLGPDLAKKLFVNLRLLEEAWLDIEHPFYSGYRMSVLVSGADLLFEEVGKPLSPFMHVMMDHVRGFCHAPRSVAQYQRQVLDFQGLHLHMSPRTTFSLPLRVLCSMRNCGIDIHEELRLGMLLERLLLMKDMLRLGKAQVLHRPLSTDDLLVGEAEFSRFRVRFFPENREEREVPPAGRVFGKTMKMKVSTTEPMDVRKRNVARLDPDPYAQKDYRSVFGGAFFLGAETFAVDLQNMEKPVLDVQDLVTTGTVYGAAAMPTPREAFDQVERLTHPDPEAADHLVLSLPLAKVPMKMYFDLDVEMEAWDMIYGYSLAERIAIFSAAQASAQPPPPANLLDVTPLAYWDSMRYFSHGRCRMSASKFALNWLLGPTYVPHHAVFYGIDDFELIKHSVALGDFADHPDATGMWSINGRLFEVFLPSPEASRLRPSPLHRDQGVLTSQILQELQDTGDGSSWSEESEDFDGAGGPDRTSGFFGSMRDAQRVEKPTLCMSLPSMRWTLHLDFRCPGGNEVAHHLHWAAWQGQDDPFDAFRASALSATIEGTCVPEDTTPNEFLFRSDLVKELFGGGSKKDVMDLDSEDKDMDEKKAPTAAEGPPPPELGHLLNLQRMAITFENFKCVFDHGPGYPDRMAIHAQRVVSDVAWRRYSHPLPWGPMEYTFDYFAPVVDFFPNYRAVIAGKPMRVAESENALFVQSPTTVTKRSMSAANAPWPGGADREPRDSFRPSVASFRRNHELMRPPSLPPLSPTLELHHLSAGTRSRAMSDQSSQLSGDEDRHGAGGAQEAKLSVEMAGLKLFWTLANRDSIYLFTAVLSERLWDTGEEDAPPEKSPSDHVEYDQAEAKGFEGVNPLLDATEKARLSHMEDSRKASNAPGAEDDFSLLDVLEDSDDELEYFGRRRDRRSTSDASNMSNPIGSPTSPTAPKVMKHRFERIRGRLEANKSADSLRRFETLSVTLTRPQVLFSSELVKGGLLVAADAAQITRFGFGTVYHQLQHRKDLSGAAGRLEYLLKTESKLNVRGICLFCVPPMAEVHDNLWYRPERRGARTPVKTRGKVPVLGLTRNPTPISESFEIFIAMISYEPVVDLNAVVASSLFGTNVMPLEPTESRTSIFTDISHLIVTIDAMQLHIFTDVISKVFLGPPPELTDTYQQRRTTTHTAPPAPPRASSPHQLVKISSKPRNFSGRSGHSMGEEQGLPNGHSRSTDSIDSAATSTVRNSSRRHRRSITGSDIPAIFSDAAGPLKKPSNEVASKGGRVQLRQTIEEILDARETLEDTSDVLVPVQNISYSVGRLSWKVPAPPDSADDLDQVLIAIIGVSGKQVHYNDESMQTHLEVEDMRITNLHPGPDAAVFRDRTGIVWSTLERGREPCQRCGLRFSMAANQKDACRFHAFEDGRPGEFRLPPPATAGHRSSAAKAGHWTCCGQLWEGAPGCRARPHQPREVMLVVTAEAEAPVYIEEERIGVWRLLQLHFFPGVEYHMDVQVTRGVVSLFDNYLYGGGPDEVLPKPDDPRSRRHHRTGSESPGATKRSRSYDAADGGGKHREALAEDEPGEVLYVKRACVGSVNVVTSTSGYIIDRFFREYTASLPFFEKTRKVLNWKRLLEKYIYYHCVDHLVKETLKGHTSRSKTSADAANSSERKKRVFLLGRKVDGAPLQSSESHGGKERKPSRISNFFKGLKGSS